MDTDKLTERRHLHRRAAMCALATTLLLGAASAWAQSAGGAQRLYKCVDSNGKVYYTQLPPQECQFRKTEELNKEGMVVKQNAAPPTPEERAKMEAEREANKKRLAEEAAKAKEQKRLDDRLLNTYTSEKDIDDARERSLKENEVALKETEKRLDAALKTRKDLDKEKDFYANKPLPARLEQSMQNNEAEIKYQQDSLELRRKQVITINAKYDDDKRRYLEIMKRQAVATGSKK
jgi:hypothetical protein